MSPHPDADRLRKTPWLARVTVFDEVGSTNTAALQHARAAAVDGSPGAELFLAERQTAGRGRGGNQWWSARGALTFSLLTEPLAIGDHDAPRIALDIGAALCRAVAPLAPTASVALKWPNDVYLQTKNQPPRKLAGVLIESTAARPRRLVIGVGLNANNRLADAPPDLQAKAVSLCHAVGGQVDPTDLLERCLAEFRAALDRVLRGGDRSDEWNRWSLLNGRGVRIDAPARVLEGRCVGIGGDGAIVVETERDGRLAEERIVSGVVSWFANR